MVSNVVIPYTVVIGINQFDTIPTERCTILGPWQPVGLMMNTLGGPATASTVDFGIHEACLRYSQIGFDIRYAVPPMATISDYYGCQTGSVNPNESYCEFHWQWMIQLFKQLLDIFRQLWIRHWHLSFFF